MLNINDAAGRLGVTGQTVRNMIRRGTIAYIKVGARFRIEESEIERILTPTPRDETKSL